LRGISKFLTLTIKFVDAYYLNHKLVFIFHDISNSLWFVCEEIKESSNSREVTPILETNFFGVRRNFVTIEAWGGVFIILFDSEKKKKNLF